MFKSIYSPGAMVKVLMGGYDHYAIVSDKVYKGKPMLISLSRRTGTVREEPWDICTGGRKVALSEVQGRLSSLQVLANAKSMIGKIRWDFISRNCEHYARWTHGLKVESRQLKVVAAGLVTVLGVVFLTRK